MKRRDFLTATMGSIVAGAGGAAQAGPALETPPPDDPPIPGLGPKKIVVSAAGDYPLSLYCGVKTDTHLPSFAFSKNYRVLDAKTLQEICSWLISEINVENMETREANFLREEIKHYSILSDNDLSRVEDRIARANSVLNNFIEFDQSYRKLTGNPGIDSMHCRLGFGTAPLEEASLFRQNILRYNIFSLILMDSLDCLYCSRQKESAIEALSICLRILDNICPMTCFDLLLAIPLIPHYYSRANFDSNKFYLDKCRRTAHMSTAQRDHLKIGVTSTALDIRAELFVTRVPRIVMNMIDSYLSYISVYQFSKQNVDDHDLYSAIYSIDIAASAYLSNLAWPVRFSTLGPTVELGFRSNEDRMLFDNKAYLATNQ